VADPTTASAPATAGLDLQFHHLGVACERIEDDRPIWEMLGYRVEGAGFADPAQGIRGLFMVGGGPRIELLEALDGSQTLAPWLKRRVKLYHAGFLAADFAAALDRLVEAGGAVTREPIHSVYFGALIAFVMMPNMALIELVEAAASTETRP
jgi:methylmalonyl-CoA/ethylmalonyl-CoA epimerase